MYIRELDELNFTILILGEPDDKTQLLQLIDQLVQNLDVVIPQDADFFDTGMKQIINHQIFEFNKSIKEL